MPGIQIRTVALINGAGYAIYVKRFKLLVGVEIAAKVFKAHLVSALTVENHSREYLGAVGLATSRSK